MRRLFWMGVGAAGAVLAAERLRRMARRYTPAGVSERVEAAGQRTSTALHDAVDVFNAAREQREKDLVATLLVTPEGGDPNAVFRRRGKHADDAANPAPEGGSRTSRPSGRVDDDEPLYDF